jgi:GNAT superfamily N-acetyltransferase
MPIHLRPIQRPDAPRLAVLLDQLGYPTDEAAVHLRLDYWLDEPCSWLIGAEDDRTLVGVAALHLLPMFEATGRFGRLVALVVDDRYRGRGVGGLLVSAAEEQARSAGCVLLEISSSRHRTRAHEFYQRLGYEDRCPSSARFVRNLAQA